MISQESTTMPWKWIFLGGVLLVSYMWNSNIGPFGVTVPFNFYDHAVIDGDDIIVSHEGATWIFDSGEQRSRKFRVYGQGPSYEGDMPPGAPFEPVTHLMMIEPLKVNQEKISRTGHEEDDHSTWIDVAVWPTSNAVIGEINDLDSSRESRTCAEITGRYARILDYQYPDPAYASLSWKASCTSHHQCETDRIYIVDKVVPIDCNLGI